MFLLSVIGTTTIAQPEIRPPAVLEKCSGLQLSLPQSGMLAANSGSIYVGSTNGVLTSYASRDLSLEWRLEIGGEFAADILPLEVGPVAVTNSVQNAANSGEGSIIRLIGGKTGVTSWSADLPFSEKYFLGRSGNAIAAISRVGVVTMFNRTGELQWRSIPFGTVTARPAFQAGRIVFGTGEKHLIVISGPNEASVSKIQIGVVPRSVAFSKKGDLLVGGDRGNVEHIAIDDGKAAWKFKTGAAVSSIMETDEGILVTSLDNFVYLISDYNGNVIWKRRLTGRIVEGGVSLGGYFVVLVNGENTGYALELATGKIADVFRSNGNEIISGSPMQVRPGTFAFATTESLEIYAFGGCGAPAYQVNPAAVGLRNKRGRLFGQPL